MGSSPIISTNVKAAVAELVDALDLKSSCSNTVRVRFPPAARLCGYRIVAIMRPCQGRETGSIPVTRSESNPKGLFFILEERDKRIIFCFLLAEISRYYILSFRLILKDKVGFNFEFI